MHLSIQNEHAAIQIISKPITSMPEYIIPAEEVEYEFVVQKSRFIAAIAPAFSVEDAKQFISEIKKKHSGANHHVSAYVIGHGNSEIAHCTDDGEPSGTAGRPVLAVIRGSGVGDIVTVVTRYFGGVKLGTGGLVRAYSGAVRGALLILPRGRKVPTHTVSFVIGYSFYERVKRLVNRHHGSFIDEIFTSEVSLSILLSVEQFDVFQASLIELTSGAVRAEIVDTNLTTIVRQERDN